jgi:hypothetical protein
VARGRARGAGPVQLRRATVPSDHDRPLGSHPAVRAGLAAAAVGVVAWTVARVRTRRRIPIANSVIRDPEESTVVDESGAVRSVQAADITMPAAELERIWSPMQLERLARTYWRYLSRITLGLIQVRYTPDERAVVLVTWPFVLLRFHAPDYAMDANRGIVRWRIKDGLLVARQGHDADGYLEIDVRRVPEQEPGRAKIHVVVSVANFYPAIASTVSLWFYKATQSRIHVIVTHGFLRSLARLDLAESKVGRFVPRPDRAGGPTIDDVPDPPADRRAGSSLPAGSAAGAQP